MYAPGSAGEYFEKRPINMFYINEKEVEENLPMGETIEELEKSFVEYGKGEAQSSPRERNIQDGVVFNTMPAISKRLGLAGMKTYIAGPNGAHFVVLLFDSNMSRLIAVIEANKLGQIRTGALPAMVTRHLANGKGHVFTLIGSGFQAETQLKGILEVADLSEIRVYSRTFEHARNFAQKYSRETGMEIRPFEDVGKALKDATIVNSMTDSNNAIFSRSQLGDRYHVNLAGGNLPMRQEAADDVLAESDLVVVEHLQQALIESGEIIHLSKTEKSGKMVELKDFILKKEDYADAGRTVFKSMGIGLEDIAAGYIVLKNMGLMEKIG